METRGETRSGQFSRQYTQGSENVAGANLHATLLYWVVGWKSRGTCGGLDLRRIRSVEKKVCRKRNV